MAADFSVPSFKNSIHQIQKKQSLVRNLKGKSAKSNLKIDLVRHAYKTEMEDKKIHFCSTLTLAFKGQKKTS